MATVAVSNSTQLSQALRNAGPDTRIELASGTYTLSSRGGDFHGATITAATGAEVSFSQVTLNSVSHLTFDNVDFIDQAGNDDKLFVMASSSDVTIRNASFEGLSDGAGYGRGVGLWVNKTTGFTLENSQISDFTTGSWLGAITDLTVRGNTYTDISLDGMIVGGIHGGLFADNEIDLHVPSGVNHTDGMQFYNSGANSSGANDPLTDLVIRDNHIETHNKASHGIYMANALADPANSGATFFRNLTIEDNIVISGQVSGIAVGQTIGLDVHGNIILQDPAFPSSQDIGTPVIRVAREFDRTSASRRTSPTSCPSPAATTGSRSQARRPPAGSSPTTSWCRAEPRRTI